MRNFLKLALGLVLTLTFVSAVAWAEKGKDVHVYTNAVLPDGQELKAGVYTIHQSETGKEVEFVKGGKVVLKTSCKIVQTESKSRHSEITYQKDAKGRQVVQQIRLAGETKNIVLQETAQGM